MTACLVGTSTVSAQLAMPGTTAGQTNVTATTSSYANPNGSPAIAPEAVKQVINQARGAMTQRNYELAVRQYRQAVLMSRQAPSVAGDVARLRIDLQVAGIDAALLSVPESAPAASSVPSYAAGGNTNLAMLGDVNGAMPMSGASQAPTSPQAAKARALQLIAVGRAALDRGDTATALQLARQAQALNVPETAFAAGEPRVWDFALDAESAARRAATNNPIALAGGQSSAESEAGMVRQMLFNQPSGTVGDMNPIAQVQGISEFPQTESAPSLGNPSPLAPLPGNNNPALATVGAGDQLYAAGLEALERGDRKTAREKFLEAWKYEAQMDLSMRRQLKDKLTLLQPERLPLAANPAADGPMTPIEKAQLEAQAETSRLYREITTELANTSQLSETAPLDALDNLNRLRRRVDSANVGEDSKRTLANMVDKALEKQRQYVEANKVKIELDLQNDKVRSDMANAADMNARIDEEISALVDTYNDMMREGRTSEAMVVAKKVNELKPGSDIATQMFLESRVATRMQMYEEIRSDKEDLFARGMIDVERSMGSAVDVIDPSMPMRMPDPKTWNDISNMRAARNDGSQFGTVAEQKIRARLEAPVDVNYTNQPLGEVLRDLSAVTGVPIHIDQRALQAIRVSVDTPITMVQNQPLKLGSVLNIMLGNHDLAYAIKNDVLMITSEEAKRSDVKLRTYKVADLVTPIPNFTTSYEDGLAGALRAAYQMANPTPNVQLTPVSMANMANRSASNMTPASMGPTMLGQYAGMGQQSSFGMGPTGPQSGIPGAAGGSSFADFDSLMQLIQQTVVPDTWEALGGPSTMAPYPQNLSLVISTTSDVHDQIQALLKSLRSLQNLQITIEVRFITLADTFFEQIGVDFDVQFDDNVQQLPDDDSGPRVTVGWDGSLPTPDLDIRLNNATSGLLPPFVALDGGSVSSIGFAILSDIEAFFFLQAAQGDDRNNVMQAPKVTLFDGQFASISDVSQRPFVTSITPVVGDFAVAQQPVIVVLNEGTQLNVQGIVSDDKRFVRLTLVPFFSEIRDVDTFTFEGTRSTTSGSRNEEDTNGDGVIDSNDAVDTTNETEVVTGTTVQLPTFAFTSVQTTVSVPDGGTILLGGIKRMSEGRTERGIPMLSKIPYVSRLFRNVAVGRDASSLMLMVTPRIIIQEEEEETQTGFIPNR
ncbi:type II secretion system protein GspD [Stieleria varia]